VSSRTSSALVGKPQLPNRLGVKLWPAPGQQEKPVLFEDVVSCLPSTRIAPSRDFSTSPNVMPACSRS